ncbi:ubiquitin carboxyl-terminal hydrolase 13 [Ophiostoma piceae UAMH 11346]|uniref:Ubiquitin carboxyl-terminal hydrolase n=1 Tax=Ophiostoma piceae (strain UAMH 11346) TaxID=1262450 RepID=S3D0M8_OPHP1|nr:ubiquitin carboxyl-terminal hydrolase 13 [Ophiostoma piceae UAMH 11346]
MSTFLSKLKPSANTSHAANAAPKKEVVEQTPLEKMLLNAGPIRDDGTDKFFGLENFGNTCYCNSILQALYHSEPFRTNVVNFPPFSPADTPNGTGQDSANGTAKPRKVQVQIRKPTDTSTSTPAPGTAAAAALAAATNAANGITPSTPFNNPYSFHNSAGPNPYSKRTTQTFKGRPLISTGGPVLSAGIGSPGALPAQPPLRPEDKPDTPEYKKKQAMIKGPVLELSDNASAYGMEENTFTSVKDIFMAFIENNSRTGVLSPHRLLEIFRKENELFRTAMHQDAHEFYGLVLNDIIRNVEETALKRRQLEDARDKEGLSKAIQQALGASAVNGNNKGSSTPGSGWVHDIFEGVLTSETRCLTCESSSQRDETFLDLSIDLEQHSSVTSCLRKFSAEEMLCERNKFQCDHCGGLQEAEKRMKIKRLPKILALHLKRFKYSEDYTKLEKLFHRVVYPYQLRMFNTTDEAQNPDRLYELYAVVVHIGGNAYHGHYVSVIKTAERGWLLFDDEMVEPVDKHYVRNFFGDQPGTACAYVLFYQETTFEKMQAEQEREGLEEIKLASQSAGLFMDTRSPEDKDKDMNANGIVNGHGHGNTNTNGTHLARQTTQPASAALSSLDFRDEFVGLEHAKTAPGAVLTPVSSVPPMPSVDAAQSPTDKAEKVAEKADRKLEEKERREREKKEAKEAKAADKARKAQEKLSHKDMEKQRRMESEEMRKAIAASKQTALDEKAEKLDKLDRLDRLEQKTSLDNSNSSTSASNTNTNTGTGVKSLLSRGARGSKSMSRKSFAFLGKDRDREKDKMPTIPGGQVSESPFDEPPSPPLPAIPQSAIPPSAIPQSAQPPSTRPTQSAQPSQPTQPTAPPSSPHTSRKERFSFSLGRKKSHNVM